MTESPWRALANRRMLICVLTGFSSGLPLYLLLNLVPAWLKTEGLSLKAIGAFALIQFPYTWKFLWSPFLDRYALPLLGRRRSWSLLMQIGLLLCIGLLGGLSPSTTIVPVLWLAALLALNEKGGYVRIGAAQDTIPDLSTTRSYRYHEPWDGGLSDLALTGEEVRI